MLTEQGNKPQKNFPQAPESDSIPATWRDIWSAGQEQRRPVRSRTPHQEFCARAWLLFPGSAILANVPAVTPKIPRERVL